MRKIYFWLVAAGLWLVAAPQARQTTPQQPPPPYRAAVDIVQLDVSVLDKERRPVKGLAAGDFTVLENGRPQPILSFEEVQIPGVAASAPRWMREASVDVVNNDA